MAGHDPGIGYQTFANMKNFYIVTVDDHIVSAVAATGDGTKAVCMHVNNGVAYNTNNKRFRLRLRLNDNEFTVEFRYQINVDEWFIYWYDDNETPADAKLNPDKKKRFNGRTGYFTINDCNIKVEFTNTAPPENDLVNLGEQEFAPFTDW